MSQERIIKNAKDNGEFEKLDDGFHSYWPSPTNHGALTAANLRTLADELDRMNADWERTIKQTLGAQSEWE